MELSPDEYSTDEEKDDIHTSSDELRSSCILNDAGDCIAIQEEISECFKYIKTFINDKEFVQNVRNDSPKLKHIEEQLDQNLLDLKRTDCPIVFAGETSSGKSSIVNAIIGEKILPTGIMATTTRVCRVKFSKELKISTCSGNDKMYRKHTSFQNTKRMAEDLKIIAQTNDQKITYIDIFMPLPFQQGNVAIVDTPGIGDEDQKEVAQKMMDYLPNALAFVFVINVAAAGGLQKDRFIPILDHVKKSLKGMVCFDPDDVIFLLNKWDTLLHDDEKEMFFKTTEEHLRHIWKDVKSERILRLSMNTEYREHGDLLRSFKDQLEDVVEKNKKKRCERHLRFLIEFVSECDRVLSPKLERAKENADASHSKFEKAMAEVSKLKKIWHEESLKLDENVMSFIDAVTDQLHEYIHNPDFKENMLKKIARSWRLQVTFDVKAHIETDTKQWEERHMHKIYDDIFVKRLNEKLQNTCDSLAENLLKGFKMPYDPDNKILKGIFFSTVSIVGGFVARALIVEPPVAVGLATIGIVFTGLLNFGYISDFKTVCEDAVNTGIKTLSKERIKQNLKERYIKVLKRNVDEALKTMKTEIEKLEKEQKEKETESTINNSRMRIFDSLNDKVYYCRECLKKIAEMC